MAWLYIDINHNNNFDLKRIPYTWIFIYNNRFIEVYRHCIYHQFKYIVSYKDKNRVLLTALTRVSTTLQVSLPHILCSTFHKKPLYRFKNSLKMK